jgi:hypothetical protein
MTEKEWMNLALAGQQAALATSLAVKIEVLDLIEEEMEDGDNNPMELFILRDGAIEILDSLAEAVTRRRERIEDLAHGRSREVVSENQMVSDTPHEGQKSAEGGLESGEKCIEN